MQRKSISCQEATQALSPDKERQLIGQAQIGDEYAFEKLLAEHKKCIKDAAKKFYCPGLPLEPSPEGKYSYDLEQAGIIGFWEAVVGKKLSHQKRGARFDLSRESRLWTFAWHRVDDAMRKACHRWNQVRYSVHINRAKVMRALKQLRQELQREPSAKEVAAHCGVKLEVVKEVLLIGKREKPLPEDQKKGDVRKQVMPIPTPPPPPDLKDELRVTFERVIEIFGPTDENPDNDGAKWITLLLLREWEEMDYSWTKTLQYLTTPSEEVTGKWETACDELPLPAAIPHEWAAVCTLFGTPPPTLKPAALRQWYSKKRRALSQAL